jgi:hypothetical protein
MTILMMSMEMTMMSVMYDNVDADHDGDDHVYLAFIFHILILSLNN